MVCPITNAHRSYPWRVEVEPSPDNELKVVSYVETEDLRSISTRRGDYRVGSLDPVLFMSVRPILKILLDLQSSRA